MGDELGKKEGVHEHGWRERGLGDEKEGETLCDERGSKCIVGVDGGDGEAERRGGMGNGEVVVEVEEVENPW